MVSLQQWKEKLLDILDDTFYRKSEIDEKENVLNESINEKLNIDDAPTKTSDLTNDSGFLTEHQDISGKANNSDLENLSEQIDNIIAGDLDLTTYAKKSDLKTDEITDENTYSNISNAEQTQESINAAIDDKLGALSDIDLVKVVGTKPTASAGTMNKLYLVAESSNITEDNYEIFITVRSGSANNYSYTWEKIDTARVNLSNYIQKSSTVGLVKNDGSIDTQTIPTKTSDLTNDSNFVTTSDSRLTDTRNPRMIHIGASSSATKDLDNYTTAGFYYCNNDINEAKYITNQPLTSNQVSFFLLVETWNGTSYIKQTLTYYANGDTYVRTRAGDTTKWKSWRRISFADHNHDGTYLTHANKTEYIQSTQTSSTSAWTGTSSTISSIERGTLIFYRLSQAPTTNNVTLNLTLKNGTTTGAKGVYIGGTRVKNQFPTGSVIMMVFDGSNWLVPNENPTTTTATLTYANGNTGTINLVTR